MERTRYNKISDYLKEKFGERVLKICVDGGFTCPNRDGKCGTGGCIFCTETGSGDHLNRIEIKTQVKNYFESYKAKRANKFILYFQNFTNTYAPIPILKEKYDSGLISDKIVGLAIATRPDCIDENIIKFLKSYQEKYFVWVELGLQTSNDVTGKIINRCYSTKQFENSVKMLNLNNIPVVSHIMIGLPNENFDDLKNTVSFLNTQNIWGIKIHSTYITKNTGLHKMYLSGNYQPISFDDYITQTCYVLTHINPNVIVHRISGDAPKDILIEPKWNLHKKPILNGIEKYLKNNNLHQGCYFNDK